jgi:hypothetical protein
MRKDCRHSGNDYRCPFSNYKLRALELEIYRGRTIAILGRFYSLLLKGLQIYSIGAIAPRPADRRQSPSQNCSVLLSETLKSMKNQCFLKISWGPSGNLEKRAGSNLIHTPGKGKIIGVF